MLSPQRPWISGSASSSTYQTASSWLFCRSTYSSINRGQERRPQHHRQRVEGGCGQQGFQLKRSLDIAERRGRIERTTQLLNRMVGGGALFLECAAGFDVNRDRGAPMIGHSMGGDIVMYFAKEYPDEVKWVVTLDNLRVRRCLATHASIGTSTMCRRFAISSA